ncbi:hypothetical protein [Vibrio sp. WXL103]|uniref:hypothetical protein n=1 Tax=Vibrio sp. WXL103 TaxID=3450710 RepID=UPI003EC6E01B
METLRDITGFQAIGRVLEYKAKSPSDVVDFMNFLGQLLFYDHIQVACKGPTLITENTLRTITMLTNRNVPQDFICKFSYSTGEKAFIERDSISKRIYNDWIKYGFPILSNGRGDRIPEQYGPILINTVKLLKEIFVYGKNPDDYRREIANSIHDKEISYTFGIFLNNKQIIRYLRNQFTRVKLNDSYILDLIIRVRNKLNAAMASENKLFFDPTYSRASDNYHVNRNMKQHFLSENPKHTLADIDINEGDTRLNFPSAINMLLFCFGDRPEEMLDKTLAIRETLSFYRKNYLSNFNNIHFFGNADEKQKQTSELECAYNEIKSTFDEQLNKPAKLLAESNCYDFGRILLDYTDQATFTSHIDSKLYYDRVFNQYKDKSIKKKDAKKLVNIVSQELVMLMNSNNDTYLKRVEELFKKTRSK